MRVINKLKQICKPLISLCFTIKYLFCSVVKDNGKTPKLSYAFLAPDLNKLAFGGKIKLSILNSRYKEQTKNINILYLVSSAINIASIAWYKKCKKNKIIAVWNQNGVAYPAWAGEQSKAINKRMSECLHKADYVVYQSKFCKYAADKFLGEFKGKSSIIYNSVDTNKFKPATSKLSIEPIKLLIMGSHENRERVIAALDVLHTLVQNGHNVKLEIAGRLVWENAQREVQNAIKEKQIEQFVTISGPYLQDQAIEILQSSHILLHLKYADPCPRVVIEALACGVPVVASSSGGVPELVEDAGQLLDVPLDLKKMYVPGIEPMAEAVLEIISQWDSYSIIARKRAVEKFDDAKWLDEHTTLFTKLLS